MKPIRWLLRVVGLGFLVSLLSTSAMKMPRFSVLQWIVAKIGWGRDPFKTTHGKPVVWRRFREEVRSSVLRGVDEDFLADCQVILDQIPRQGQVELGVKVPQTVRQHNDNLRALARQYGPAKKFSARDLLELDLMFACHELAEMVKKLDVPRFRLPPRSSERRFYIRNFKVPSPQKERARLRKEWRKERPFVFLAMRGLSLREQLIVIYFYDRFYLGNDTVACFGRQLHYLEPALDIRRRTRSGIAREWHYNVAATFITDGLLRQVLDRAYRVGEEEPAEQKCLAPEA